MGDNMRYQDQRSVPFLLPFLAGAVIGPLFFNGFGYNNCQGNNCGYPNQGIPPIYQAPIYQAPIYQAPIIPPVYGPYI